MEKTQLIALILLAFLLAGCVQNSFTEGGNETARGAVVWNWTGATPQQASAATVEPSGAPAVQENLTGGVYDVAENILVSLNSSNYTGFARDFSGRFGALMTEKAFNATRGLILNVTGFYERKARPSFYKAGGFAFYSFPAKFQNDEVNTTVILNVSTGKVEGIVFDSPLLSAVKEASGKLYNPQQS